MTPHYNFPKFPHHRCQDVRETGVVLRFSWQRITGDFLAGCTLFFHRILRAWQCSNFREVFPFSYYRSVNQEIGRIDPDSSRMAMVYSLKLDSGGLICPRVRTIYPKLPSHVYYLNWRRFKSHNGMQVPFRRVLGCPNLKVQHTLGDKYTVSAVGNRYHLTVKDDYDQGPFWSNLMKEALRAMKSLVTFLVEQPNQLKHIEWPSFQSTLKTAIFSLILVGVLIIALASVDSALCYMLSLLLRKRV